MQNDFNIKQTMTTVVSMALDKDSIKKFEDASARASEAAAKQSVAEFQEAFGTLAGILNKALSKLNMPEIDISDMIKMSGPSEFKTLGEQFGAKFAEGFKESLILKSVFLKEFDAVNDALQRKQNAKSVNGKKKIRSSFSSSVDSLGDEEWISTTSKGIGKQLGSLRSQFDAAEHWEDQYVILVKYLQAYEKLETLTDKINDNHKTVGGFSIEQLKEARGEIEASIKNIFNANTGNALLGLTKDGRIDVHVNLVPTKTLGAKDIVGGDGSIKVNIEPVIKTTKHDANAFRGIHHDIEEGFNSADYVRDFFGGSYFAAGKQGKFVADGYGKDSGLEEGTTLSAKVTPVNELTIDLGGRSFDTLDRDKLLQYLFPGLDKFTSPALLDADGRNLTQKFYNEMARQSGYDLMRVANTDEGGDAIIDEIVPLQERVVEYIGNVPEFYDVEKFTDQAERVILSQQRGSAERYYEDTLGRLNLMLAEAKEAENIQSTGRSPRMSDYDKWTYINKDNVANVSQIIADLQKFIPIIENMRDTAFASFDKEVAKYGGYIGSERERGLPKTIVEGANGGYVALVSESSFREMIAEYDDAVEKKDSKKQQDILSRLEESLPQDKVDDFYDAMQEKSYDKVVDLFKGVLIRPDNTASTYYKPLETQAGGIAEGISRSELDAEKERTRQAQEEAAREREAREAAEQARRQAEEEVAREREAREAADAARRLEEEAKSRANERRNELAQQLELYDDDKNAYSLEESELQKTALQDILNTLKQEDLLTDELQAKYDAINSKIDERINLLKSVYQAYDSLEEAENIDYNPDDINEVQQALDKRKEIISAIPQNVLDNEDDIVAGVEEIEQGNIELEKRIDLLKQVKQGLIDIDDVDDIINETGDLDSKLERLGSIAEQWGSNIKDGDEDDAEKELEAFEETYDRIVLKLAKGKKIEILPNAKGLRALHKYNDGIDSSSYGETEIEDVIFERVKKEADAHRDVADALRDEAAARGALNDEKQGGVAGAGSGDASLAELEATKAEAESLRQRAESAEREKAQATEDNAGLRSALIASEQEKAKLQQEFEAERTSQNNLIETLKAEIHDAKREIDVAYSMAYEDRDRADRLQAELDKISASGTSGGPKEQGGVSINKEELSDVLEKITYNVRVEAGEVGDDKKAPWAREETLKNLVNKTLGDILTVIKTDNNGGSSQGNSKKQPISDTTKNNGVSSQADSINTLLGLYEKLGMEQEALRDANERNDAFDTVFAQERIEELESYIALGEKSIEVTELLREQFRNAEAVGGNKWRKQQERNKASQIAADVDNIKTGARAPTIFSKDLIKEYQKLGWLRAEAEGTPSGEYLNSLNTQISELENTIKTEVEKLGLYRTEIAEYEAKTAEAYNQHKQKIKDKEAKEHDAARKKTSTDVFKNGDKAAEEYQKIVDLTKEYNKWSIKAAKTNKSSDKTSYTTYANEALEKRNVLLKQYIKTFGRANLSQEQQAELIALTTERQKKLNEAQKEQKVKDFNVQVKEAQSDVAIKKTGSALRKSEGLLFDVMSDAGFDNFDEGFKAKIKQYENSISQFKDTYSKAISEIEQKGFLSDETRKDLIEQMQLTDKYTEEISELQKIHSQLQGDNVTKIGTNILGDTARLEEYERVLTSAVMKHTDGKAHILGFNAATKRLAYEVKGAGNIFIQYEAAVDNVGGALVEVQKKTRTTESLFDKLYRKTKEVGTYFMGSLSIYTVVNELKKGIQYVKEIDSAMTELKKVTDETDASYERFLNTATKTSSRIGSTISEFTQATAEFARLGYNMDLASQMAEAALVYSNVGDGIDASAASESIISTMKGFGMAASESMKIVDRFNEVGNRFAITSVGIGDALQRSASALYAAGNTIDESIGLIAAANSVVQDPTTVGTALKTLSLRVRGAKIELEEAGEDIDGMANSTSELQQKLLALTGGKVDIMLDENSFKNTTQILREMAGVWDQMSDVNQAAALELLGGKRQANVLSAIISDFETVEEVIEASADSAGSALKENEKYLDSIRGKIDQFTNTFQSLWNNLLDSKFIKDVVDFGAKLLQLTDNLGALNIAFAGLVTFVSTKFLKLDIFDKQSFKDLFSKKTFTSIDEMKAKLESLKKTYEDTQTAYAGDPTKKNLKARDEAKQEYEEFEHYEKQAEIANENLQKAQANLKTAENALRHASGKSAEEMKALQDDVNNAQQKVNDLTAEQQRCFQVGTSGWKKLGNKAKAFGKQVASAITQMLVMYAISKLIELATNWFDSLHESAEEAADAFDELNNELKKTKEELDELTTKLEEINLQIEEIRDGGPLSFTEQEQLDLLEAERKELERQVALKEQLAQQQQQGVNAGAIEQANYYRNTGVKTGKTANENIGSKAGTGALIGAGAGVATGVGASVLTATGAAAAMAKAGGLAGSLVGPLGTAIGIALGALVGAAIGAAVGGIQSASEETVGGSMDSMREQYKKLQQKYQDAQAKYHKDPTEKNKKKFEEAQEAFTSYQSEMAKYIGEMDAHYSSIDLEAETDPNKIKQLREEMNAFYDEQDKWAIMNGGEGAKTNALNRIFGDNADATIKKAKERAVRLLNEGKEVSIEELFGSGEQLENFKDRMYDIGIYMTDVINYLEDFAETSKEVFNTTDYYGVAKDIAGISDELESLNGVLDEINEKGTLSAETIVSLSETFGSIEGVADEWNNFVKVMMSTTSSTMDMQEATELLAQAWLKNKLLDAPMTYAERVIAAAKLTSLGIKNGFEYIEDANKEAVYNEIAKSAMPSEDDVKKEFERRNKRFGKPAIEAMWDAFTKEDIAELGKEYGLVGEISVETAKEIASAYGLESEGIEDVVSKLNERLRLEKEIADIEKKQDAYDKWRNADDGGYLKAKERFERLEENSKYAKAKKIIDAYNSGTSWYDITHNSDYGLETDFLKGTKFDGTWYNMTTDDFLSELNKIIAAGDKELEAAKVELDKAIKEGVSKGWLTKNADGTYSLVDGVEEDFKTLYETTKNEYDNLVEGIKSEFTDEIELELDLKITLGSAGTAFDEYTSSMETLASIQSEVAQGFIISAEKAREFAGVYPEILKNATTTANGQIQLNSDVVNAFLSGKREELDAEIDAEIAKIDAQIASLEAENQLAEAQLDLTRKVINGELEMSADQLVAEINNSNALSAALQAAGMDDVSANKLAYAAMSTNANEYDAIVKEVAANNALNFDQSAADTANSMLTNFTDMQGIVQDFMLQCQEAAKAVAGISSGSVDGDIIGISGSGGTKTVDLSNYKVTKAEFKGTDAESPIEFKTIDLYQFMGQLQTSIDENNTAIDTLRGTRELLEAQKNRVMSSFDPSNDSSLNGSRDKDGNGKDDVEETNELLEEIAKQFDRVIENLDNQQTYIQNEIEIKEANGEAISKSYYEELKKLESDKLGSAEAGTGLLGKRQAILNGLQSGALIMTDEVAAELWNVEHAIQESTLRIIEFDQSIVDLYTNAFDKLIEAYDNSDDFLSDQQNYINKYKELMELQGEAVTAGSIQEQIAIEEAKIEDNVSELSSLRQALADGMSSGYIKEGSEAWVDMQDKIRATEEAILDNKIAIEEYRKELNQLSVDAFEFVRKVFTTKDSLLSGQQDYIQGYIDLLETVGVDVPEAVYQKLIDIENNKRDNFVADLVDARTGLDKIANTLFNNAMASNPEMANWTDEQRNAWLFTQDEFVDGYNTLVETEKKIQDCDINTAKWSKEIRELDFEKFDRFIDRLKDVHSELDKIRGLFDNEKVANEDGTWTKEGITSLGLAVQQMTVAQSRAKEYGAEISAMGSTYDEYVANVKASGDAEAKTAMSEKEWYDRLQQLKDGQWDAIDSYEAAKDAIVDMEEARIDMIEEGLNKEIEAYEELIELKKEELDAERDLYDFKKKVKNQTKSISELQRRIASLSGSTADSDIAERKKLEAQLREEQENLDDTYYQHSKDSQSKALDDELENFQKIREDYIEELRETLEDTAAVIAEKMTEVLVNADIVHQGIKETAEEYGFPISDALIAPWLAAKDSTMTFTQAVETSVGNIKTTVENSTSPLTSNLAYPWEETTKEDGPIATFSKDVADAVNGAVGLAKDKAKNMFDLLSKPWKDMVGEDGPLNTFNDKVEKALDAAEERAKTHVDTVNSTYSGIKYPNYVGSSNSGGSDGSGSGSGSGNGGSGGNSNSGARYSAAVEKLQKVLKYVYQKNISADGIWGRKTSAAVKEVQNTLHINQTGKYDKTTQKAMQKDLFNRSKLSQKEGQHVYADTLRDYAYMIPQAFHAKGTLGTKQDEWAITDESWIGEEITLAAGKNGQLQYLKKGSAVMPADISANLVEWGKLNPNMMSVANASQGINLMSNYVNKPELNLSFEALVKAQNITEETLPAVKKLVTEELDKFTRKLNYAMKRV